nr:hypothetical protein Iba_chr11eCG13140 [Ipomoea batatas]
MAAQFGMMKAFLVVVVAVIAVFSAVDAAQELGTGCPPAGPAPAPGPIAGAAVTIPVSGANHHLIATTGSSTRRRAASRTGKRLRRENQRREELAHVATTNFARQRKEPEVDLARCVNQLTRVSPLPNSVTHILHVHPVLPHFPDQPAVDLLVRVERPADHWQALANTLEGRVPPAVSQEFPDSGVDQDFLLGSPPHHVPFLPGPLDELRRDVVVSDDGIRPDRPQERLPAVNYPIPELQELVPCQHRHASEANIENGFQRLLVQPRHAAPITGFNELRHTEKRPKTASAERTEQNGGNMELIPYVNGKAHDPVRNYARDRRPAGGLEAPGGQHFPEPRLSDGVDGVKKIDDPVTSPRVISREPVGNCSEIEVRVA